MLAACVALVLLINAAYQQGDEERDIHVVMKWAVRLACVLVAVFAALAAYSLGLRIAQYGLTPERVMAAVGVVIAVLFGIGYPVAAVWPKGRWLHRIETVNVTLAFVKVVVFLAVLTPLADPLRLSVDSQVARLTSGVVDSDHFDWNLLRFQTGTYGTEALTHLAKSGKTNAIRKAAATAAARKDDERWQTPAAEPPAKPNPVQFHMVQPGAALPVSFLAQAFTAADNRPDCLKAGTVCQAALLDLNDDGKPELLLLDNHYRSVFAEGADGIWSQHGNIIFLTDDDIHAFEAGKVEVRRPAWNDVKVGDNVQSLR
ncbi:MAG: DUF4153 domain-containing protein [Asticcacaulis sp.]|nr:DUF4153 domain-containing protein [Asticcacaulis sp.]